MIYLTLLFMIVYGALAIFNIGVVSGQVGGVERVVRFVRLAVGLLFIVFSVVVAMPLESVNQFLLVLMAVTVVGSGEIGKFKIAAGDRDRVFLVHAFTAMLMVGFAVLIFVL